MSNKNRLVKYGRRSKSKSKVSKEDKEALPGAVKLSINVTTGPSNNKFGFKRVPFIGSLNSIKRHLPPELRDTVNADTDLTSVFVKAWYLRLRKERAYKIAFIDFMQNCVRSSYMGQLPTWFKKRVRYSSNDKTIDEYFKKARRILGAYLLYRHDGQFHNLEGRNGVVNRLAQGHLLVPKSCVKIQRETYTDKYLSLPPGRQFRRLGTLVKFKDEATLAKEVKPYDGRLKHIHNVVFEVVEYHRGSQGDIGQFKKYIHKPNSSLVDMVKTQGLCPQLFERFVKVCQYIESNPEAYVDMAINQTYGGYKTSVVHNDKNAVHNLSGAGKLGDFTDDEIKTYLENRGFNVSKTSPPQGPGKDDDAASQSDTGPQVVVGDIKTNAQAEAYAEAEGKKSNDIIDSKNLEKFLKEKEPNIDPKKAEPYSLFVGILTNKGSVTQIPEKHRPIIFNYLNWYKGQSSFGMRGRHGMRYRRHPRMGMLRSRRSAPFMRRSKFGRSPTLSQMQGYVNPSRMSSMERYTGMTPSRYRQHIGSPTGVIGGGGALPLSQANDYYGGYRLGERLGSSYGRRGGSDIFPKVPKKTRKRKRSAGKKSTKKKRKTRRKSSNFGKFFF